MYAKLGDIEFKGLFSFESLGFEVENKISHHDLINTKAKLQSIGQELEKINISLIVHREFQDPEIVVSTLRGYVADAKVLPYLDGAGKLYGNFILKRMSETVNILDFDGSKISVTLALELIEYYDPAPQQTEAISALNNAHAVSDNSPVQVAKLSEQKTVLVESLTLTKIGQTNTNDALQITSEIQQTPAQQASGMDRIKSKMEKAVAAFQGAVTAANKKRDKIEAVSANFVFDLEAIETAANSLRVAAENGDISGVVNFSSLLAGRASELTLSRLPLDFLAISKRNI